MVHRSRYLAQWNMRSPSNNGLPSELDWGDGQGRPLWRSARPDRHQTLVHLQQAPQAQSRLLQVVPLAVSHVSLVVLAHVAPHCAHGVCHPLRHHNKDWSRYSQSKLRPIVLLSRSSQPGTSMKLNGEIFHPSPYPHPLILLCDHVLLVVLKSRSSSNRSASRFCAVCQYRWSRIFSGEPVCRRT